MSKYYVQFTATTGFSVEVEAGTEEEARVLALQVRDDMSSDHLPELWQDDFDIDIINKKESR